MKVNKMLEDKIRGSLYCFAIGDAMGATTEFMNESDIKHKYGIVDDLIGGGWLNTIPGEVTDDTQMTICVIDAIMNCDGKIDLFEEICASNFIKWYNSNPKDVGGQCSKAINILKNGKRIKPNNGLGNGSLMRALPCALYGNINFNVVQGKLTHPDRECKIFVKMYHDEINNLLYDSCIERDFKLSIPTGYVLNTFSNSMYWLTNTASLEEAIVGAVNHGGDSDTIAAITGGLVGAKYGYSNIPKKWVDKLDNDVKIKFEKFIFFIKNYLQI